MTDEDFKTNGNGGEWEGFREIDRAIAENRLTAYSWKKIWADPWGRIKMIAVFAILLTSIAFVVLDEAIL